MANGGKRVVINTRERVNSGDHNRLQDMASQARGAFAARLYDDRYVSARPGFTVSDTTGGDTPMRADVYGGLFVQVDDPTDLFVTAGVVGAVDPDASPGLDDDPYKIIDDPGVSLGGVLTFLANGAGSPRIDLVVADIVDQVLETDTRDVFDPSTGLFTPQLLNKVRAKRLSYSIIRGTAGAGMPAFTNTIVLAVASVPPGAGGWDDVTFWDVRPLVEERVPMPRNLDATAAVYNTIPTYEHRWEMLASETIVGEIWTSYGGYIAGGLLKKSTPTAVMGTGDVDLNMGSGENSTTNLGYQGPAEVPAGTDGGAAPLFALFPSGLPRWARYSENPVASHGANVRKPYGPRGILVAGRNGLTDKAKINSYGYCTGVALPTSTGLTGTSDGVCLAVLYCVTNTGVASLMSCWGRGKRIHFRAGYATVNAVRFAITHTPAAAAVIDTFDYAAEFRDSNASPVAPHAQALQLNWRPAGLQDSAGFPPPDPTVYQNLGFYHLIDGRYTVYPQQSLCGDGTVIPTGGNITSEWFPVRQVPGTSPAQTFEFGISAPPNSPTLSSVWEFDGSDTLTVLLGYEMP